jgi:hypothetical protein
VKYLYKCPEGHVTEHSVSVEYRNYPVACTICGNPAYRDFGSEAKTKRTHVSMWFHNTVYGTKEEEEGTYGGRWV